MHCYTNTNVTYLDQNTQITAYKAGGTVKKVINLRVHKKDSILTHSYYLCIIVCHYGDYDGYYPYY